MKGLKRSFLFIPGNNPGMVQTADLFDADVIIFDLEDAVAQSEKDSARNLIIQAFTTYKYKNCETMVRINAVETEDFELDIEAVCRFELDYILLPKATVEDIIVLDKKLEMMNSSTEIFAIIESAIALETAFDIAKASKRVKGLLLGGEDLTADLGVVRTKEGLEIQYARNRVAVVCKALGILAIDTPYTDVVDEMFLVQDSEEGKRFGMMAKASISPRHIETIHSVYAPSSKEVIYAYRVLCAMKQAKKKGFGVFSLDGKMIDSPIVKRAERIYQLAKKMGLKVSGVEYDA
ncbi:MAG: aldolase/citrate lyase family protein [Fusobacteria bacterium]|nr:aldolase/citrate lyase family protein [Fusobacteriota bacterium]